MDETFADLALSLAERRRVAEPRRPTFRYRRLMEDARFNPIDWPKLRAAPEWSDDERRQMDADCKRLRGDEDYLYSIWKPRWNEKWVRRPG